MNIAILTDMDLRDVPVRQWLRSKDHHLLYLADECTQCGASEGGTDEESGSVRLYSNYMHNGNIELDILELHQRRPFDVLVAIGEDDVIRAARLRERLGVAGQTLESAIAFRDKGVMKDRLSRAGIPMTSYRVLRSALDLISFKNEHGLPLIIKPTSASGSSGLHRLGTEENYRSFLAEGLRPRIPFAEYGVDLMAEVFVEGIQYHIDGFVLEGNVEVVVPSRYLTPVLPKCSSTLEPEDPFYSRLVSLTRAALEALPCPSTFSFHAEIFRTKDDRLLVNEIASRPGGGKIGSVVAIVSGVNLNEISVVGQVDPGLAKEILENARAFSRCAGVSLFSPPNIELCEVPEECPLPEVSEFRVYQRAGYRSDAAPPPTPTLAAAVIRGDSAAEVQTGLARFNDWFLSSFTKPLPPAIGAAGEVPSKERGEKNVPG